MAKIEQLHTSVSAQIYSRFIGIAAERNLSNAALLRNLVEELIEAYDAGRAIFQKTAAPRLDTTVSGLIHQLKELVIEMDRAQADNVRMQHKLHEKWNGGEEANRLAQQRLIAEFRKQDEASLSPFLTMTEELLTAFEELEPKLFEALETRLTQIADQLAKTIELASEPREMRGLYLGDNRMLSLKFLSACGGLMISLGVLIGLVLPGLFGGWSVWQASKLIDSPAQMCRLIEKEYGRTDCVLPDSDRELGLRVIAHEDRQ